MFDEEFAESKQEPTGNKSFFKWGCLIIVIIFLCAWGYVIFSASNNMKTISANSKAMSELKNVYICSH